MWHIKIEKQKKSLLLSLQCCNSIQSCAFDCLWAILQLLNCRKLIILQIIIAHRNANTFCPLECNCPFDIDQSCTSICRFISAFLIACITNVSQLCLELVVISYTFPHKLNKICAVCLFYICVGVLTLKNNRPFQPLPPAMPGICLERFGRTSLLLRSGSTWHVANCHSSSNLFTSKGQQKVPPQDMPLWHKLNWAKGPWKIANTRRVSLSPPFFLRAGHRPGWRCCPCPRRKEVVWPRGPEPRPGEFLLK